MKYCKDCKYISRWSRCEHPLSGLDEDVVYGPKTPSCYEARSQRGVCGPDAVLFEVFPPPRSFWDILFNR
jgi:hypothetical protein